MPVTLTKSQVSVLALIACTSVVYALSAPAYLLGGDSAEFVTLMSVGGVAHPPGYPLYVLWLRLVYGLFHALASPPHLASLATVPWGVAAVACVYAAARAHGAKESGALLGALAFAFAPIAWRLNTQPEVFAPHVALCALLVWLCARAGPLRGLARVAAISVVGGATLAMHHTALLIGPTVLYGLVIGIGESKRRAWAAPIIVLCGLVGLTPYLSLFAYPSADGSAFVWRPIATFNDLFDHFLRREYGTFQLSPHEDAPHPLAQIGALTWRIAKEVAFVPVLLACWSFAKIRDANKLTLLCSFLLAGPVFAAMMNIPPYGPGQLFVPRFYMLPLMLLCVWIGIGADVLRKWTQPAALLLAVALILLGLPQVQEEHRPTVDNWLHNALSVLPDDAVVLVEGDHRAFSLEYAQRVEHAKPNVLALRLNVLTKPAERARVAAILGHDIVSDDLDADKLIAALMKLDRPVFVTLGIAADLMNRSVMIPAVPFFRLLNAGEAVPDLQTITANNRQAFEHFRLEAPSMDSTPSWATLTLFDYSEAWVWLAKRWQARHDEQQTLMCIEQIGKLAPWLAEASIEKIAKAKR